MCVDAMARLLAQLQRQGSVRDSRISDRMRQKLASLFDHDVLTRRRSGRGFRVHLEDREALRNFIEARYPNGLKGGDEDSLPPKAAAIARRGDSKKGAGHRRCPVLLRGFDGERLTADSEELPLARLTRHYGLAALEVTPACEWTISRGPVVLVENFESFMHVESVVEPLAVAVYTSGVVPDLVLRWLKRRCSQSVQFVHFADYDPKGLHEYCRIHDWFGDRLRLLVPDNFQNLLRRFAKRELLDDARGLFEQLRNSDLEEVRRIAGLLHRHGGGLEQEALLIEPGPNVAR